MDPKAVALQPLGMSLGNHAPQPPPHGLPGLWAALHILHTPQHIAMFSSAVHASIDFRVTACLQALQMAWAGDHYPNTSRRPQLGHLHQGASKRLRVGQAAPSQI